jgi:hypothetical protein
MAAYFSRPGNRPGWFAFLVVGLVLGSVAVAGPNDNTPDRDKASPTPAKTPAIKKPVVVGESGDAEHIRMINEKLAEKWKENKITPSARANDYEFVRRASLDIIGRIARPDEIQRFLKDPEATRRAKLIERLLVQKDQDGDSEYAKNWANIWTVWLLTRSGANQQSTDIYHKQMHRWLEDQFAKESLSFKELVRELLTAEGKTNENGAVNYILAHLGEPTPRGQEIADGKYNMVPLTSRTARLFLGVQLQCAQCHPHPFNKEWTQKHFWGINAFFRQVDTPKGRPMPGRRNMPGSNVLELVDNLALNPEGTVFFEQRNGLLLPTKPRFIEEKAKAIKPTVNRRQELAKAVTESPLFSRAYVNRMWAHFFGRGFTNPVDDFGPENEPSHPELLDELAAQFVHYGYDPKRLIRWICNSDAYNLTCVANRTNEKADAEPLFGRMLLKAMSPEQLFESLMTATQPELPKVKGKELKDYLEKIKQDRRNMRDKWIKSLTANFGDDEGNEVTFNGTVVQALMMMNGKDINDAITDNEKGMVAVAIVSRRSPQAIMDHLYKAALNRPPSGSEQERVMKIYHAGLFRTIRNPLSFWQDVYWALLNSNEFMLNH